MNDKPIDSGLCDSCEFSRKIVTRRGSGFLLCGRSTTDGNYQRYPRLPVLSCAGYLAKVGSGGGEHP